MTDRISAIIVVLEQDIREDDAKAIVHAIEALRHVLSVKLHVSNAEQHIATERAKFEMQKKILDILMGRDGPSGH